MEQFAQALSAAVQQEWPSIEQLTVVVRSEENTEVVRRVLDDRSHGETDDGGQS